MCDYYKNEKHDHHVALPGIVAWKVIPRSLRRTGPMHYGTAIRVGRWMRAKRVADDKRFSGRFRRRFRGGFHGFCVYFNEGDGLPQLARQPKRTHESTYVLTKVLIRGRIKQARDQFGKPCGLAEKIKFTREHLKEAGIEVPKKVDSKKKK